METAHMVERLRPFLGDGKLSPSQVDALQSYVAILMRWNVRTNLTAVRGEENIVTRHIGESLFAARHVLPDPASAIAVIDVGSGAGFPGVPLKIYAPAIELTLIESQNKKATFLKEAIRTLRLQGARVFAGRAETFEDRADLVTMRAVERFESVVPIAASLVRSSSDQKGRLALLVGQAQVTEAKALLPEWSWAPPLRLPLSSARCVLIGKRRG